TKKKTIMERKEARCSLNLPAAGCFMRKLLALQRYGAWNWRMGSCHTARMSERCVVVDSCRLTVALTNWLSVRGKMPRAETDYPSLSSTQVFAIPKRL